MGVLSGSFVYKSVTTKNNMSKKEEIWSILVRYLEHSLEDREIKILDAWLEESSENRRLLNAIDRIWKSTEQPPHDFLLSEFNLEKDWEKIAKHIAFSESEGKQKRILHFKKLRKRQQIFSHVLKIAALVLVAFTSVLITLQFAGQPSEEISEPVFNEIITHAGERASIELGDGSKVVLNAASKLTIPEAFSAKTRDVQLSGQAFFDVKSDRNRPFYIHTDNAIVEVIGTSFDVRSYEEEDEVLVVVRDGTIELRRIDDDNKLIVNEGYLGVISRSNGRLALEQFTEPDLYFGWMDGRLIFKDTPMADVFNHLERWYNVEVQYDDSDTELMAQKFTADLKTRSVREVMDVIKMSMEIDYEILDGEFVVVSLRDN